ncbi:MAG: inorganic phosphate transporter [Planctomycetes bacterium]|nr:inorganic phosphate transporter [Planctomycetota bacterium]
MDGISFGLIVVLLLVLWGELVNGWTDAPNAMATVVSTRVLSPMQAMAMTVVFNLLGVLLAGTAVAATIGKGIVDPSIIDLTTIGAAMLGIIVFSTGAWFFGLPTSESHALIAGLTGAGLAKAGVSVLVWAGWKKVLLGLVFSTFLGFGVGFIIMFLIYRLFARIERSKGIKIFGKAQILSSAFMAFSHGTNDGQKFIGVFALALALSGVIPMETFLSKSFSVPFWIILICALMMALGTAFGGWKIMKTMGFKMTKLEPVHGFSAETGAAITIEVASRLGIPLSTTHTINTAIMGVGATKRLSAVRWGVSGQMVMAWILTFPVCALIAYLTTKLVMLFS